MSLDDFSKIELQSLHSELSSLQNARYTVLGLATATVTAYLGWVVSAGNRWSVADALIPVFVLITAATLVTGHFWRLIVRGATYLDVFYSSPWQMRLRTFRTFAAPTQVQFWLALYYFFLGVSAVALLLTVCEKRSAWPSAFFAGGLGVVLASALVWLSASRRYLTECRNYWEQVARTESSSEGARS